MTGVYKASPLGVIRPREVRQAMAARALASFLLLLPKLGRNVPGGIVTCGGKKKQTITCAYATQTPLSNLKEKGHLVALAGAADQFVERRIPVLLGAEFL